ncbi:hypothetical protein GQ602_000451 [Ophiocordyceps camponoti-floridani]|uniref:Uncharacterized protein n=1 Tax=Ophiocordyceps camponoti-floridani TaxID=2030778 RepID=A0A8H4VGB0_9HYPO|nr:hypothetical protein GQ602_000451 [Ophiocordyceps camponoti-floridani]
MWRLVAVLVPALIHNAGAVTNPRDCPTVTSTVSVCPSCLPMGCVIPTVVPCHPDCPKPVPTMMTRFPCGERCPGACSKSYSFMPCP